MKKEEIKELKELVLKRHRLSFVIAVWMCISQLVMIILKNITIPDFLIQFQDILSGIIFSFSEITLIERVQASIMIAMIPLMLVSLSKANVKEYMFKNLKNNTSKRRRNFSLLFLVFGFIPLLFYFGLRRLEFGNFWFSFPLQSGFLVIFFAFNLQLFIEVFFDSSREEGA